MAELDNSVPISERVRFWEEQDAINQELIPRVIRQHELLTEHIGEHENLPAVVANAVQQAIAGAREEQRQLYDAALEAAQSEFSKQLSESLQQQSSRMRTLFIGVATVAGLVIVALSALIAVIVG